MGEYEKAIQEGTAHLISKKQVLVSKIKEGRRIKGLYWEASTAYEELGQGQTDRPRQQRLTVQQTETEPERFHLIMRTNDKQPCMCVSVCPLYVL